MDAAIDVSSTIDANQMSAILGAINFEKEPSKAFEVIRPAKSSPWATFINASLRPASLASIGNDQDASRVREYNKWSPAQDFLNVESLRAVWSQIPHQRPAPEGRASPEVHTPAASVAAISDPVVDISNFFPSEEDSVFGPSSALLTRILEFISWKPGWDGSRAENIEPRVATLAIEIVLNTLSVVNEPFVAPAPSGALLLQWDFPSGVVVDLFVDSETEFPETAVLVRGDSVQEIPLAGHRSLRTLLSECSTMLRNFE